MFEKEYIARLVTDILAEDPCLFLVDVKISSGGETTKVKVIIDGDNSVSIDDCANLSRHISEVLDSDDDIQNPFVLEVTSPGFEHPLKLRRQYVKNIGRKVKVILKDKSEKKGKLKTVESDFVVIQLEQKNKKIKTEVDQLVEIPFDQIEKTNIQVSFK